MSLTNQRSLFDIKKTIDNLKLRINNTLLETETFIIRLQNKNARIIDDLTLGKEVEYEQSLHKKNLDLYKERDNLYGEYITIDDSVEKLTEYEEKLKYFLRKSIQLNNNIRVKIGEKPISMSRSTSPITPYSPTSASGFSRKLYEGEKEAERQREIARKMALEQPKGKQEVPKSERVKQVDIPTMETAQESEEMKRVREDIKFDEELRDLILRIRLSTDHVGDFIQFTTDNKDNVKIIDDIQKDITGDNKQLKNEIGTLQRKLEKVIEQNKLEEDFNMTEKASKLNIEMEEHMEIVSRKINSYVEYISRSIEEYEKRLKQQQEMKEIDSIYKELSQERIALEKINTKLQDEIEMLEKELGSLRK